MRSRTNGTCTFAWITWEEGIYVTIYAKLEDLTNNKQVYIVNALFLEFFVMCIIVALEYLH